MNHQPPPSARKRSVAAGLTAGLIGGAAAGIAFGVPAITGAADDPDPSVALLQETDTDDTSADDSRPDDSGNDDTETEDTGTDDTGSERDADHGDHLRELLEPLVEDGTIDADQADAVVEHLMENRPERRGPGGLGHCGGPGGSDHHGPVRVVTEAVTDLLGLEAEELFDQLRDGATLAEVAEANGVDRQELVDTLVAEAQEHLDEAVEDGRLDADEAAERAADLEDRVSEMIDRTGPNRDTDAEPEE